jgi:type I restriction enzyme S subunit
MSSNEWQYKKLGDTKCFKIIMGQSPPSSTYNDDKNGLPFFQGKAEFGDMFPAPRKYCTEPSRIAEKDDILISVRAPVGPTNLANQRCCIGRGLAAIRCLHGVMPRFLLYALRTIETNIAESVRDQGGGFTAIKRDQLKAFEIPIPPLEEQHRIIAQIEELTRRAAEARETAVERESELDVLLRAIYCRMIEGTEWKPLDGIDNHLKGTSIVCQEKAISGMLVKVITHHITLY